MWVHVSKICYRQRNSAGSLDESLVVLLFVDVELWGSCKVVGHIKLEERTDMLKSLHPTTCRNQKPGARARERHIAPTAPDFGLQTPAPPSAVWSAGQPGGSGQDCLGRRDIKRGLALDKAGA